jgi:hypothetical protein
MLLDNQRPYLNRLLRARSTPGTRPLRAIGSDAAAAIALRAIRVRRGGARLR